MKYDNALISKNIESFRSKNYRHEDVTIYFDMDNTLCLFSPFGDTETSFRLMHQKGFYRELACFPEAPAVIENLIGLGYKVKILSSCIDSPYCASEKKGWVAYHLPAIAEQDVILLPNGEEKSNYIESPGSSILVDDYYCNIVDIYKHGGIGVKKTFSGKQRPIPQVCSLVDIFSVLASLNCL